MTTTNTAPDIGKAVHLLAAINRLHIKSFGCRTQQSLTFLILNDSVQIIKYDRAVLWKYPNPDALPELLGVSGHAHINKKSEIAKQWLNCIQSIPNPKVPQILSLSTPIPAPSPQVAPSVAWIPVFTEDNKLNLGIWLERWTGKWHPDELEILNFLSKGYGVAWESYERRFSLSKLIDKKILAIAGIALLALLVIRVPLRISAPCEVIANEPYLITAPLEGIIDTMEVVPGQLVKKDEVLFEYDKRVPTEELRVAQKEVQIAKSQLQSANSQSYKDQHLLSDLGVLSLKLKKEEIQLNLAKYRVSQLTVKAPYDGVVMFDNPEDWQGRSVKVGEKVMTLSDPTKTKVQIWIPESDNIDLSATKAIRVFLNVYPDKSYDATINYISSYTTLNDKSVPSFVAEARWDKPENGTKLGWKGTAILYGDNVSIFYWIVRKPWAYIRNLFGF